MNQKQYYSILVWLTEREIVNEKGEPLDFKDHLFLLDILTDWNQHLVVKACAQIGKSITFTLKTLFAIKYLRFNVIYTFPSDDDVREFVSSKVNKILQANSHEFGLMDTDSIERKEINDRFIFFKGTISKTAAISNTADLLVHDEASRSNQSALETYKSRLKASDYKGRWIFSNPTTEKDLLDQEWHKSDRKEWCVTCPSCKVEHFLVWPDSIDKEKKCFVCRMCREPITDKVRRKGKWIPQNPGSPISGYHISHLIAPRISASEIIEDSEGDQEYFYNFILGEPYNPGDLTVSRSTILDIWTPKDLVTGNYYLGVDVGNIKHYVLGSEKGIIKVGKFDKWQDLDDLIVHYKIKGGVIDALPDNTMSKYYVDKYQSMQMSFFQENASNPQTIVWWGDKDRLGIVYSHRDRALDRMIADMVEAKFLISIPSDKMLLSYVKHFETLRRVKETNAKGIERYVWDSTTGEDHFVFATLYYWLALQGSGSGQFWKESLESDKVPVIDADNVYDVSRIFRENNYGE
jgi:Phage terminase large subunit (GpA)